MILRLERRANLLPFGKSARRTSGTRISAPFGGEGDLYPGGRTYEFLRNVLPSGKCCDVKKRGLAGFANPSRVELFCRVADFADCVP